MMESPFPSPVKVGELLRTLRLFFSKERLFHALLVEGEVGRVKEWKGAYFFDLRDGESSLSCSYWPGRMGENPPEEGEQVLLSGDLTLYEKRGSLSFRVSSFQKKGEGERLLALRLLKERLYKEGAFSPERKKKVPSFATDIALVLARGSAAEADLRRNILRRWPLAKVTTYGTTVQGKRSLPEIEKALGEADENRHEVVVLARGGGSKEDLAVFDEEGIVRAILRMRTPLVAAIGHEIDKSLADLAADMSVSTPTAAAEAITADMEEIVPEILSLEERLGGASLRKIERGEEELRRILSRPLFQGAGHLLPLMEKVSSLRGRLAFLARKGLEGREREVLRLKDVLESLSPQRTLQRGYSITTMEDGRILREAKDVLPGAILRTRLMKGEVLSRAEVREDGEEG